MARAVVSKAPIRFGSRDPAPKKTTSKTSRTPTGGKSRVDAVMKAAENSGLMGEKSARIGGRISPTLIEKAKKRSGIDTDTDLIEFALANIALGDDFAETFRKTRGTVNPALKLGF
jgi:hypothetical protein